MAAVYNKTIKTFTNHLKSLFVKQKSSENRYKNKPTIKESLKVVFLGRKTQILLLACSLTAFLVSSIYSKWIYKLSINERAFDINYDISTTPADILNNALTCNDDAIFSNCGPILVIFLVLPVVGEIACIAFLFTLRKSSRKRVLVLFFIIFQLVLAGILFYYLYIPERAVNALTKKANSEIKQAIELLNSKEQLNQVLATPADCISCTINKIEQSEKLPLIIDTNPAEIAVMKIGGTDLNSKSSFYKAVVIPYLLFNKGNNSDLDNDLSKSYFEMILFPDSTLIIGFATRQSVQSLAPILSRRLLQQQLSDYAENKRVIEFNVLDQKDYVNYQTIEEEKSKKEILNAINEVKNDISYLDGIITDNQNIIDNYEANVNRNKDDYDYYVSDLQETYDRLCETNDYPECKALKSRINENRQVVEKERADLDENRKNAEIYNNEAHASRQEYISVLDSLQRTYNKMLNEPITAEYQDGISYTSQGKTFINFYTTDTTKSFNAYLFTSLHEYLHQISYTDGESGLPMCLEEGITDRTAALLLKEITQNSDDYITYVFEEGVVNIMLDTIPFDELMGVYFDKSDTRLKSLFEKYYDSSSYKDFVNKCNYLYYTDVNDLEAKNQNYKDILDIFLASVNNK